MSEPITLKQQIQCVGREIGMRKNVYPKFVASKRMTQEKADAELAQMNAVYRTLKALDGLQNGTIDETTQQTPAKAAPSPAVPG